MKRETRCVAAEVKSQGSRRQPPAQASRCAKTAGSSFLADPTQHANFDALCPCTATLTVIVLVLPPISLTEGQRSRQLINVDLDDRASHAPSM